jgi:hypothetical protein
VVALPILLIVAVPVALLLGHHIGDLVPMLAFLAVAVVMIFAVPPLPKADSLAYFVVPLGVAVVIKMARGDKRGRAGNWRRR